MVCWGWYTTAGAVAGSTTAGVGTLLLETGHYCWGWYTTAGDGSTTAGVGTLLLETGPLLLGLVHYCWSWGHWNFAGCWSHWDCGGAGATLVNNNKYYQILF